MNLPILKVKKCIDSLHRFLRAADDTYSEYVHLILVDSLAFRTALIYL